MVQVRVLSAADVSRLLDAAALRRALESALVAQSNGLADVPPRIMAAAPSGLLAAMPGFLADAGNGMLATKLVSIYPDNVDAPSHQGFIAYFDATTGTLLALMDAELITEDRTAGTAAIAADLLARDDADTLTLIGAGAQGRAHVRAFAPLREWKHVHIVSRTPANADALAEYAASVGLAPSIAVVAIDDLRAAIASSSVVALCTHADTAVFDDAWVGEGTHVSSVGSRAELPVGLVNDGNVIVVDHEGAVTTPPPAGAAEVQHAVGAIEIGSLIARPSMGRRTAEQVTVYKSTGHAVQDIAAAHLVYTSACRDEVGVVIEF